MRATPYAIPFRRPLMIGGGAVPAHRGLLVECGDGIGAATLWPGAVEDWTRPAAHAVAIEIARGDAAARAAGVPLAEWFGGIRRTRVELNALLVEGDADACAAEALRYVTAGYRCLKLKLAPHDLAGDLRRLAAVRAAVGTEIDLRADANAAWTVDEALGALRALAPFELEYVEQPVADILALAAVRRAAPMPIGADEAILDLATLDAVIAAAAADVVVLKPAMLGLRCSLMAARRAHAAGLGVVVTSVLDSTIGIAAAAHVAAAIDGEIRACGLATAELLAGDLVRGRLEIDGAQLVLPRGAGLGVELDRKVLGTFQSGVSFSLPLPHGSEPPGGRLAGGTPAATSGSAAAATAASAPAPTSASATAPTSGSAPTVTSGQAPTVRPWIDQRAVTHGEREAVRSDGVTLTWSALRARAAAASARLAALGVGRGDRVALLLADRLAFAVWLHGVTRLGAVAVPLGDRLPAAELARQLATCDCAVLVDDATTRDQAAALPASACAHRLDAERLDEACSVPPARLELDAPHTIIFTSGSTGAPTPVLLTAGNHYWSALGSGLALGVRDDDRWLACLPPHHVGGLAILMRGVIGAVPAVLQARFDVAAVLRALDDDGITLMSLVPAMLQRLLEARGRRSFPPTLRRVLLGGAPAPRALCAEAARRGLHVALTYGMTETASQLVTDGRALCGAALRIVGAAGEVAAGEVGRIAVRGPMRSPGRLGADGTLIPYGDWLTTNDLGSIDADGDLTLLGRADDVVISGGENVHPREVEVALESHPAVAEACAFGLPDPTWGEIVAAQVRLRDASTDTAAIAAHVRRLLAPGKLPRRIEAVADFPRSAAGKILRRAVRDAAGSA
jgi:O-succinylbenzoic acid--CoA ligase